MARNGPKTATYHAASFLPHYRRVLILHLLVLNLWYCFNFNWSSYLFYLSSRKIIFVFMCVFSGCLDELYGCSRILTINENHGKQWNSKSSNTLNSEYESRLEQLAGGSLLAQSILDRIMENDLFGTSTIIGDFWEYYYYYYYILS